MENNTTGVVIERIFDAPREKVWEAWTTPEIVQKWWGPETFTAPSIKIDLRVGGKYIFAMKGPVGSGYVFCRSLQRDRSKSKIGFDRLFFRRRGEYDKS